MVSMFGIQEGDEIHFAVARSGISASFTVKGFYEDPFMGSSMIGMKGFLIGKSDYEKIEENIRKAGIDGLARSGAMLHIFREEGSTVTVSELNVLMNEQTKLPEYTEFVHSEGAIAGFMLILQNAFSGLLTVFASVLLFVVIVALGHGISSSIEADYVNMGILKTIGFTGKKLRRIQMIQYLAVILSGMAGGLTTAVFLSKIVSRAALTITGVRIPTGLPLVWCFLVFTLILLILTCFIALKTGRINAVSPMKAIRGETENSTGKGIEKGSVPIFSRHLTASLAVRQLVSGKRKYAGACTIAVLLVFFATVVGRMNSWLGSEGQGMMSAFNPADHDIGIQVSGRHTAEEAESLVRSYTEITDRYLLAMPGVSVNGIDYTANVISDPGRFHIVDGRTCLNEDEIVLTEFVASDLGVFVGDDVTVQADSGSQEYTVSGIYTCANDMGDNVGMSREGYLKIGRDRPNIWCSHYFLADASKKEIAAKALEAAYGGDVHVHENTWPGLDGMITAMQALLVFLYAMVIIFIMVVTAMTGSKILSDERKDIGIYKSIGFTSGQLRGAFALRFGMAAVTGSVTGTVLAALLTDPLVSSVMKMAGISSFSSGFTPGNTLFPAAAVILLFTGFAYVISWRVKHTDLTVLITE
ncbi:ABC transporter permease [Clostridium sp. AM58-1XD]|nr:ABC transporter permease [Clostridium sp. AM58-1XD]